MIGTVLYIEIVFIYHVCYLQDTLIVWSEGDNFDLALSFQEKAGCDEIWEKICQVQGKDPSVDITQDIVEESEDERFDDMSDSAPPVELPPCELSRLEEINEVSVGHIIICFCVV
jgi:protein phosphatase-4 regulatory subunit 3